ncbi:MAG: protein rep [Methylococcaceae bacterium]
MNKKLEDIGKIKGQLKTLENIVRDNHRLIDTIHADKIAGCCNSLTVNFNDLNNGKIVPYTCGSPLCPLCLYFDTRREMGKFSQVFKKIKQNQQLDVQFMHLMLSVRDCHVNNVQSCITHLKYGFEKLRKRSDWKRAVRGDSVFFHFGLNANNHVQPHLHVLLLVNKNGSLTVPQWTCLWAEALGVGYSPIVSYDTLESDDTLKEVLRFVGYGMKMVKFTEIIKYPATYCRLMTQIQTTRLRFHHGEIYKLRAQVVKEYANRKNKDSETLKMLMKFDGQEYYQDKVIVK